MKALVVYDSVKGNTEMIAQAIGKALAADTLRFNAVNPSDLKEADLLVLGSPTYGGRPTRSMQAFVAGLTPMGKSAATFDTRIPAAWVKLFGFAADKMAKILIGKGAKLIGKPAGFFVKGSNGPLKEGELERAAEWAKKLVNK
jgi:flavodoxin I